MSFAKVSKLALFVTIAACMLLFPIAAFAATTAEPTTQVPTFPPWVIYVVGVLFNIGVVTSLRLGAIKKGQQWLSSGRAAPIFVYAACAIEQLFSGHFNALNSPDAFLAYLSQVAMMAGATLGTHAFAKTGWRDILNLLPLFEAKKAATFLIALCICCSFAGAGYSQVLTTQTLTVPAVRSVGTTPLQEIDRTFSVTVFWDQAKYGVAPISTELWRNQKLHVNLFGLVKPVDKVQVGTETAIGYDIYWSKPFRKLFRNDKIVFMITPYYGLSQDLTSDEFGHLVTKPFPGLQASVTW